MLTSLIHRIKTPKHPASGGNAAATGPTGKSAGAKSKELHTETPHPARATNPTGNGRPQPRSIGSYVIELLKAGFARRSEAKKKAPFEASAQVKALLQAVKDDNSSAAHLAMSKLENAVAPLLSKKRNAPTCDELIASFIGEKAPKTLTELQTLREGLRALVNRPGGNGKLELPLFVVEANVLKLQTELFQNVQLSSINEPFFHPASLTKLDQLTVTQLELLAKMNPFAESVKQHAERLSRDDKIPGTDLTLSSAKSIAARTDAAELRWAEREQLLSGDLETMSKAALKALLDKTSAWLNTTTADSSRDVEMYTRNTDTLNAIHEREQAELRAKQREKAGAVLLAKESKASTVQASKDLLSEANKWLQGAPEGAAPDTPMWDMCKRLSDRIHAADLHAKALAELLEVDVYELNVNELNWLGTQLKALSHASTLSKEQNALVLAQQGKVESRIAELNVEAQKVAAQPSYNVTSPEPQGLEALAAQVSSFFKF